MTTSVRSIGLALVLGLVVGALTGAGAVLARGPLSVAPQPGKLAIGTTATNLRVPVDGAGVNVGTGGAAGTGAGGVGSAVAYPFPGYPGSAGLAPDHTIVVTGVGQANLAADGSGRNKATETALKAASPTRRPRPTSSPRRSRFRSPASSRSARRSATTVRSMR